MLRRLATQSVEKALSRQAAVAVIGPRQVGKTTLALDIADTRAAVYLDLENTADRGKLENPDLFCNSMRMSWWCWMRFTAFPRYPRAHQGQFLPDCDRCGD